MSDVVLLVNGQKYTGWTAIEIEQNLQAVSSRFLLNVSDTQGVTRTGESGAPLSIYPGDACAIELDQTRVITGYVDQVRPSFDAGQHELRLSGRDKTADLVDCSVLNAPGEFNQLTLERIVSALCKPFGIAVRVEVGAGRDLDAPLDVFSIQPSESVWEVIERAARLRGVFIHADAQGDVLISAAKNTRAHTALIQGGNILRASADFNHSTRFSVYNVQASSPWSDDFPAAFANAIEGFAYDENIKRFRPKVIKAETASSSAQAQRRAQWEAAVRAARSGTVQITTPGWTQGDGSLWKINTLVTVRSPWLSLDGDLLITAVRFSKDDTGGTQTQLTLMRADAFEARPKIPANTDLWQRFA